MLKKTCCLLLAFSCFVATSLAQNRPHTTLWKIEGNGLTHPSYLFGTYHDYDGEAFTKAQQQGKASVGAIATKAYLDLDIDYALDKPIGKIWVVGLTAMQTGCEKYLVCCKNKVVS